MTQFFILVVLPGVGGLALGLGGAYACYAHAVKVLRRSKAEAYDAAVLGRAAEVLQEVYGCQVGLLPDDLDSRVRESLAEAASTQRRAL